MKVRVRTGGLMRCCLATLQETMELRERPIKEGETMVCRYCGSPQGGMIYRDHAWEWDRPKDKP